MPSDREQLAQTERANTVGAPTGNRRISRPRKPPMSGAARTGNRLPIGALLVQLSISRSNGDERRARPLSRLGRNGGSPGSHPVGEISARRSFEPGGRPRHRCRLGQPDLPVLHETQETRRGHPLAALGAALDWQSCSCPSPRTTQRAAGGVLSWQRTCIVQDCLRLLVRSGTTDRNVDACERLRVRVGYGVTLLAASPQARSQRRHDSAHIRQCSCFEV